MNLGEMAWKVHKEEVIRLAMVRIGKSLRKEREELYDIDLGDDINSYIKRKIERLTICCDLFADGTDVAEKDLEDFDLKLRKSMKDTLVYEAKNLARGGWFKEE